jgi:hypothetical protein
MFREREREREKQTASPETMVTGVAGVVLMTLI